MRHRLWIELACCCSMSMVALTGLGQSGLVETGKVAVDGKQVPYLIRSLPVSSFPDLPAGVVSSLTARGCLIPQTYEAKRPENVVHASLEKAGSSDWAVLCAVQGRVSLLVFFASGAADKPLVLSEVEKTDRLQRRNAAGDLGFNWGIDPASPGRVHDAQAGMAHRPPAPDHDCLAETVLDRRTVYRLYSNGVWKTMDTE